MHNSIQMWPKPWKKTKTCPNYTNMRFSTQMWAKHVPFVDHRILSKQRQHHVCISSHSSHTQHHFVVVHTNLKLNGARVKHIYQYIVKRKYYFWNKSSIKLPSLISIEDYLSHLQTKRAISSWHCNSINIINKYECFYINKVIYTS